MASRAPLETGSAGGETQQKKNEVVKPVEAKRGKARKGSDAETDPSNEPSGLKSRDDLDGVKLESLRASKLTPQTSTDDVRAPGIFERVKEEVEAIAESIEEDHLNHKSSGNYQGGCFSWLGFSGFHRHHHQNS